MAGSRKLKKAGHNFGQFGAASLELTRMVIDGRDYPPVSSDYTLQGRGAAPTPRRKSAVGAALGCDYRCHLQAAEKARD